MIRWPGSHIGSHGLRQLSLDGNYKTTHILDHGLSVPQVPTATALDTTGITGYDEKDGQENQSQFIPPSTNLSSFKNYFRI